MPNFSQTFPVEEELLDFRFSLIHRPDGARYWVAVYRKEDYVASFYFEKSDTGDWSLSDQYKVAPAWVPALAPLLSEAINSHKAKNAEVPRAAQNGNTNLRGKGVEGDKENTDH